MGLTIGAAIVSVNKTVAEEKQIVDSTKINCPFILRNQHLNGVKCNQLTTSYKNGLFAEANDKGASLNRNNAIKLLNTDLVLIFDDDIVFKENSLDFLRSFFEGNDDVDCLIFNMSSLNASRPLKFISKNGKVNSFFEMSFIGPFNICIRKKSLVEYGISFDERFGPGTHYPIGEDSMFARKLYDSGMTIMKTTKSLGEVQQKESTYYTELDRGTFLKCIGITYYVLYKHFWWVFCIRRLFRDHNKHFFQSFKTAKSGINEYKEMLK